MRRMSVATDAEIDVIPSFCRKIADIEGLDDEDRSEKHLLRWLRARELNLDKAVEMLKKSLEWRRKNGIDASLLRFRPPASYKTDFPFTVTGFDEEGSPIIFAPFWDIRQAVSHQRKTFVRFKDLIIESVFQMCKAKGVTQFIFVTDMSGFEWKHLKSKAAIEIILDAVRVYEANYPETLKNAQIINAPKIFTLLFNLIKPLLTKRTISKIDIHGQNPDRWKPVLIERLPSSAIPRKYGGTLDSDEDGNFPNHLQLNFSDENYDLDHDDDVSDGLSLSQLSVGGEDGEEEEEDFLSIKVGTSEKFDVEIETKIPNQILRWHYKSEHKELGFMIQYKNENPEDANGNGNGTELDVVLPYEKHEEWKGTIVCDKVGVYICTFDNTFSRFRSKLVNYKVKVMDPPTSSEFQSIPI